MMITTIIISDTAFPAITFEALGRVWTLKPFTRVGWRACQEIEKRVKEGEVDALYEELPILCDMTMEEAQNLSFREVKAIINHVSSSIFNREYNEPTEESKNPQGTGPTPSS